MLSNVRNWRFGASCLAATMLIAASPPKPVSPEVRVATGILRAAAPDADGTLAFKGIPYSAPPVGELRWRAPQPAQAWEGVRDASKFGDRCLSAWDADREPGPPRSEDCLTLNVWTGATDARAPKVL